MVNKELIAIQGELKAPKNQWNDYGKYNYRNAEDILEALKPLLAKYNSQLTIIDEIVQIGERYYIKAVGKFESESGEVSGYGWAREPENKKGADDSMVTGATSSYARKYMLNGMFLIDDTKDADSNEGRKEREAKAKKEERSKQKEGLRTAPKEEMLQIVSEYLESTGQLEKTLAAFKVKSVEDFTEVQLIQSYNLALAKIGANNG